jgi:putative protease
VILDKVVHRDYDTGFFFDSPADDAKIDPDKSYNKPAFVVGVTCAADNETGLIKVTQKNKLYEGDTLNVLMPEGYMAPIVVSELYDDKMNRVKDCPHPEMTFYMKAVSSADGSPVVLPEMTFLSRDGDKDFGIPAPAI